MELLYRHFGKSRLSKDSSFYPVLKQTTSTQSTTGSLTPKPTYSTPSLTRPTSSYQSSLTQSPQKIPVLRPPTATTTKTPKPTPVQHQPPVRNPFDDDIDPNDYYDHDKYDDYGNPDLYSD